MPAHPTRTRSLWNWRDVVGGLALAVMLAMTSPGVQVARAEGATPDPAVTAAPAPASATASMSLALPASPDPAPSEATAAPICEPPAAPDLTRPGPGDIAKALEALKAAEDGEEIVTFDGTGHNYRNGEDPLVEIHRIREEIRRERVRARIGG